MKISREEVAHVAALARLTIDEADVDGFARNLGEILAYAESVSRVDTTDVSPTAHAVEICNAFRQDAVAGHLDAQNTMANAPESEDGSFVVPRVIE
ncbi:MAG: Asp-tRNA(Asn)/Glu-tRNA(Gln) amidotransferase subunit GatC [Desulfosalsimonas sp.]|uniref:Asp-tRNA(Asn)/Glu-tRNA(Gln) amidotransferase subunit GatC n=1 Tax=Desulfosalsimonas sp. TaxID=3073848 RepID=UPI003970F8DB